jgi:Uri superfamily endonuclease
MPTSSDGICFNKDLVYRISCEKCDNIYIGSTIRKLHDRIKEHLNTENSSVYKHLITYQNTKQNIQVNIIRDNDNVNLRLKEALYIQKEKPSINSRDEYTELADLLF